MAAPLPPDVSTAAHDFTLPDTTGAARRLSDLCADRPILLVFYRGNW
jgi:peroxiredoxin